MPVKSPKPDDSSQIQTQVDDEQYEELAELAGQPVVFAAVWEDSLADALSDLPDAGDDAASVDVDLYLRDGVYFELYGTLCYPDPDADPIDSLAAVERRLKSLVQQGLWLEEVAVDEDDGLVLVLGRRQQPVLYLQVGAWILDGWEELPESTSS